MKLRVFMRFFVIAVLMMFSTIVGNAQATSKPFVIALPVSLTGGNAQVGQELLTGLKIWQEMVNNNTGLYAGRTLPKGLLGRKVKLVFDDDQSKSSLAGQLVTKYITSDKADFVLPPYGSGSTSVVVPIFKQYNYALIGASASSESVFSSGYDNMVMAVPSSSKFLAGVPDIVTAAKYTSVSFVTLDNPSSLDSETYLTKMFKGRNITVKGSQKFSFGNKDFTSIWTKVKEQNPDVIVLSAFGGDAVIAMKQAAEQKISPKMWALFAGAWRNDVFNAGVGTSIAECVIGDSQWDPNLKTTGAPEFFKAYKKLVKSDPITGPAGSDGSAAWGFGAGQLLTAALDNLGEPGLKNQMKIINYLKSGKVTEFVLGKYGVDARTGINLVTEPSLFQIQDGKRVTISPAKSATGTVKLPCQAKG